MYSSASCSAPPQSKGARFFKTIDERILRDGELEVPTNFVKMHWEGMSNPVALRLPNNTEWKVRWKKHDEGSIWICHGLKFFAKDTSLCEFQSLVFQYQDHSCFNVFVFDKNGTEIKYTCVKGSREEPDGVEESDCSVIFLDEPPPYLPAKRPRFDNGSSNDMQERIKKFHEKVKKHLPSKKNFLTCAMHETYVNRNCMVLPNEFAKQHLQGMDGRSVTLFDVDKNKTWNVRLNELPRQFTFTSGWIKFARDNSLKVDDVCAFLFSKSKGLSFQVFPIRFERDIITRRC